MRSKNIALVLHLSTRDHEGKRIVDDVRKSLVRFMRTTESEDGFYLYHPQLLDSVYNSGEKTAVLGNYETDGFKFDLGFALKQSLYVAARGDEEKVLILVTDSFLASDLMSLKKVMVLNRKEALDCKVLVVGVGEKYDKAQLTEYAAQTPELAYLHTTPIKVDETLWFWFNELNEEV